MKIKAVLLTAAIVAAPVSAAASVCDFNPTLLPQASHKEVAIKGTYLQAFDVAYSDWVKNVSRGRFLLRNQTVIIALISGYVRLTFIPKYKKPMVGATTPYGIETHYVVDVNRTKIVCRTFAM